MTAPYNFWQGKVSIQSETAFNQPSAETVFEVVGKVRLSQGVEFVNKSRAVNFWRTESKSFFAGKFFTGTLEIEFGLNEILKLLLGGFFELESSAGLGEPLYGDGGLLTGDGGGLLGEGGAFTQYVFRPRRLKALQSFRLAVDFDEAEVSLLEGEGGELFGEGGGLPGEIVAPVTSYLFSGLVIDQLAFDCRRNQVPKIVIQFKAADRQKVATPALAGMTAVTKRLVHHTGMSFTMDSQALTLTEANFAFIQRKTPERFTTAKQPGRFSFNPFFMQGQLAEYFGGSSLLHAAVTDQNEHTLFARIADIEGTPRKLEIHWPAVNFNDALPDLVSRQELAYRATMNGLQSLDFEAEGPKLILVA